MEIPEELEVGVIFVGGASGEQGGSDDNDDVVVVMTSRANVFGKFCCFELGLGDGEGVSNNDVTVLECPKVEEVVIKFLLKGIFSTVAEVATH